MRIVWLRSAERNLAEQLEYIEERNRRAADLLANKIAATVARLSDHPRRGRPGRVAGTRELVVPGNPLHSRLLPRGGLRQDPPGAARCATLAAAAIDADPLPFAPLPATPGRPTTPSP